MPLPLPSTLSPSKVSAFRDCALAFRFSAIDRLPEPPSVATSRGTLVHSALERLFGLPAAERTCAAADACLTAAGAAFRLDPDFTGLQLDADAEAEFFAGAAALVERYFEIEDPTTVHPIGLELRLTAEVGGLNLVGIIDRLELDADGELVVTDYKTGRAPKERYEQKRLGGVQFYALLCEQVFGKRPARVQLMYLGDPMVIISTPNDQSIRGLQTRVGAIWTAVERACERDDFRPKPGPLCAWCSFQAFCPAFGGDPATAGATLADAASTAPSADGLAVVAR
jgi:putative RecB family exonuclease